MDKLRDRTLNWLMSGMERGEYMDPVYKKYEDTSCIERQLWYEGDERKLGKFYTNYSWNESEVKVKENYLYANTYRAERILHSGVPRLVADTMARLVFGAGTDIQVEDDETAQDTLDMILRENKMDKQHKEGASLESAFGEMAYKLSYDTEISDNVIIECVRKTNYNAMYERNRLQAVEFFEIFKEGKEEYKLCELYGKGFIDYFLYKKKKDEWYQCNLNELERTQELERVELDLPIILASVKTNKTVKGRSDYDGLISEFDSLDEAWSNFSEENRTAKTDIYYPERMLDGGTVESRMVKRYYTVTTAVDQEAKIQYEQPELRSESWSQSIMMHLNNILMNVGLSPVTVGIDNEVNSSGESRKEKEKASLRTRSERIELWQEFMVDFYDKVLQAQDMFTNKPQKDYKVVVQFGEYIVDTIEEKVKAIKDLLLMQVLDNEFIIDYVFEDSITEEDKQRILEANGDILVGDE